MDEIIRSKGNKEAKASRAKSNIGNGKMSHVSMIKDFELVLSNGVKKDQVICYYSLEMLEN